MRIFAIPSHQSFRIYASERYEIADIYEAILENKDVVVGGSPMTSLAKLYAPEFEAENLPIESEKDLDDQAEKIRKAIEKVIQSTDPEAKRQKESFIAEVVMTNLELAGIQEFADILSPIADRLDAIKTILNKHRPIKNQYGENPSLRSLVKTLVTNTQVEEVNQLLGKLKASLEKSKGPKQPADGQRTVPPTGTQAGQTGQPTQGPDKAKAPGKAKAPTDTARRQDFAKIFTAARDGKAWLPDNATTRESENFKQDIGTVAELCAADAVDKIHRGENVQPQDIENIAKAICEIFSKATRASTGQEHNELAQLVHDGLDLIWGNWREVLNRHHGTDDGPMQRLMDGFGRGSGNKVDIRLLKSVMGVVESRMRERIMNAVQQVIGSCPPPLPAPAKAQPKDLCQVYQALYAAMEGDASIMYRTKDINSILASPGGYLYGPGSISMAENLMKACQPPEEDRRSDQIKIEQMSEMILSQIVNWGKVGAGGQFRWNYSGKAGTPSNKPDKNGKIPPNPWANPGVIVFGSVVLLIMSRTVRGVY